MVTINIRKIIFMKFILSVMIIIIATACEQSIDTNKPTTLTRVPIVSESDSSSYRATPYSQSPTAGICGSMEGDIVTITIYTEIPDPRCVEAKPEQKLKVVNRTTGQLQVVIGLYQVDIEPSGEHIFNEPVGKYLATGAHLVQVSPCCSPELILKPDVP